MENTFLTSVDIQKVRHLHDILVPLSDKERKHLILTGKNGSGKTSVLDALSDFLDFVVDFDFDKCLRERIRAVADLFHSDLFYLSSVNVPPTVFAAQKMLQSYIPRNAATAPQKALPSATLKPREVNQQKIEPCLNRLHNEPNRYGFCGADFSTTLVTLREKYKSGHFILAYYKTDRLSKVEVPSTIENIQLKNQYTLNETPGTELVKYMVGMKATQAFALKKGDADRAAEIDTWFTWFENILRRIFDDSTLKLEFDDEKLQFHILQSNREPFDFNTMSSGYSAIFAIINDLVMRMERTKDYSTEGVVLIDEIEAHLHLQLQKEILPLLTELFPNIQFIVTSYSPFILNSIQNAVIYDLETQKLVADGLSNYPYDGIVEGYFQADILSDSLREKLKRYAALVKKPNLSDEDYAEIMELEQDLDEIPDFLSPEIASRYNQLKLELSNKG